MSCRLTQFGSRPRASLDHRENSLPASYPAECPAFFTTFAAMRQKCCSASATLGQQEIAAVPNRGLRHFGKALQQPRQCDFDANMIVGDIEMTGRRLPHRADAEDHAMILPSLFVHFQHRNTGRGPRQSDLEAA